MPVPTSDHMRRAFSLLPNGICVLRADLGNTFPGMTVSSVTALSLSPPLVLACIRKESFIGRSVHQLRRFSICALNEAQSDMSDFFAGRCDQTRSHRTDWDALLNSPELPGATFSLHCSQHTVYDGGDHWILVGDVRHIAFGESPKGPLIHYRSRYWSATPQTSQAT